VLTLTCSQITNTEFANTTAKLTLTDKSGHVQIFTTEGDPTVLKLPTPTGTTYKVVLTLADADTTFSETCPTLNKDDIITAKFEISCTGFIPGETSVKFPLKTKVEGGHELLPPVPDFKKGTEGEGGGLNKKELYDDDPYDYPDKNHWISDKEGKGERIYLVYFEQYKDGSFGYYFADDISLKDGEESILGYPKLHNDKPEHENDKEDIIHRTGYGIVAPNNVPLGNVVSVNGEDIQNARGGANLLYDDNINMTLEIYDNTTEEKKLVDSVTLWLYPMDTSHGVFSTKTVYFKFVSWEEKTTYYINPKFAQAFSKEDDLGKTEGKPLIARTMEHLQNAEFIEEDPISPTRYIKITHDILLSEDMYKGEVVELYQGVGRYLSSLKSYIILDGGHHTITGMKATLFGNIKGTVRNLHVSGANIAITSEKKNDGYAGIFAVNVTAENGKVGKVEGCTVKNSTISTNISSLLPGAFVMTNSGTITNCSVSNVTLNSPNPEWNVSFYSNVGTQTGTFNNCSVEDGDNFVIWSSTP
jgi:hypothetical protein